MTVKKLDYVVVNALMYVGEDERNNTVTQLQGIGRLLDPIWDVHNV
ncbi:hypothetical protein ACQKK5_26280 [Brevibacillus panacihumi]